MFTSSGELRNRKKGQEIDFDDDEKWEDPKDKKGEGLPVYGVVHLSPFNILQVGCASVLQVGLNHGQTVKAESNALVMALPGKVTISASTSGGVIQAASRALAGESFFLQNMTAKEDGVLMELAPKAFHGLAEIYIEKGEKYYVRKDGFFASQPGIECSGTIGGAREFMAQSLALLQVQGNGWFVVEAFGGVKELHVPKGQTAIVDNSHLVAWPMDAKYTLRQAANSVMDSMMSGEWVVLKFKGPCTLYISYAREETAEGRVGSAAPQQHQAEAIGHGLFGAIGNAVKSYSRSSGQLKAVSSGGGVKGAFSGIFMLFLVLFFLFPRFFF